GTDPQVTGGRDGASRVEVGAQRVQRRPHRSAVETTPRQARAWTPSPHGTPTTGRFMPNSWPLSSDQASRQAALATMPSECKVHGADVAGHRQRPAPATSGTV